MYRIYFSSGISVDVKQDDDIDDLFDGKGGLGREKSMICCVDNTTSEEVVVRVSRIAYIRKVN